MKRTHLLLGFVGCLTAEGCDPGIDPLPACGDVQETELAPEEDPEAYARAAAFAPRASFTPEDAFDADVPLDVPLDMSVAEVLAVSRLDGTACAYGEDPGFEADVLVTISAESGALHLELPAHVEWTDRSGAFALAAGDYAAQDVTLTVPYEPPETWRVVGVRVETTCDEPPTLLAWLARDTCDGTPLAQCPHVTYVPLGTLEMPRQTSLFDWGCP